MQGHPVIKAAVVAMAVQLLSSVVQYYAKESSSPLLIGTIGTVAAAGIIYWAYGK